MQSETSTEVDFSSIFPGSVYRAILDQLADGVYFVDRDRRICFWNKAAEKITGYSADEVMGSRCSDNILMHVDDKGRNLCENMCPLAATMADGRGREASVFLHHREGHRVPICVRAAPVRGRHGTIIGAVETFKNNVAAIADTKRIEKLQELAYLDELTRLANRRHVSQVLHARFAEASRHDRQFGVILADIDFFKQFNDNYGHDVGDQVLQMIARTLSHNCRPYDTVGRWGGEEFLVVTAHAAADQIQQLAERLRMLVERSSLTVAGRVLNATVSIGATMAHAEDDIKQLVARADELLYRSKAAGRNRVTFEQ